MTGRLALALAWTAAWAAPAPAAPAPAVTANMETSSQRVTVGSVLDVTWSVDLPQADRVLWPIPRGTLGGFEIRGATTPVRRNIEGGKARESVTVRVATFELGPVVLPGPVVGVTGRDSLTFHLPAGGVLVEPVLAPADRKKDIHDIKGPIGWRRPLPQWVRTAILVAGLLAILGLLAWLAWWFVRRRREAELRLPPHVRALRDLEQLRASELLAARKYKDYHVRLTEVLRRYIGEVSGFNALDLTTGEVLAEAGARRPGEMDELRRILEAADLVKFAKQVPAPGASEELLAAAIGMVERTRPMEAAA